MRVCVLSFIKAIVVVDFYFLLFAVSAGEGNRLKPVGHYYESKLET